MDPEQRIRQLQNELANEKAKYSFILDILNSWLEKTEQLLADNEQLLKLLNVYRLKSKNDGLNGRTWDPDEQMKAETRIIELEALITDRARKKQT